jgi:hypothetical protein
VTCLLTWLLCKRSRADRNRRNRKQGPGAVSALLLARLARFRHDRVGVNLRGELYPEIAALWGLAFAVFLQWEGERLQPDAKSE